MSHAEHLGAAFRAAHLAAPRPQGWRRYETGRFIIRQTDHAGQQWAATWKDGAHLAAHGTAAQVATTLAATPSWL